MTMRNSISGVRIEGQLTKELITNTADRPGGLATVLSNLTLEEVEGIGTHIEGNGTLLTKGTQIIGYSSYINIVEL